jgi:hypothetical protein
MKALPQNMMKLAFMVSDPSHGGLSFYDPFHRANIIVLLLLWCYGVNIVQPLS